MEIIHNSYTEKNSNRPFTVNYGAKSSDSALKSLEKNLLDQMSNVFSIVHGGAYKKRSSHVTA